MFNHSLHFVAWYLDVDLLWSCSGFSAVDIVDKGGLDLHIFLSSECINAPFEIGSL